MEYYNPYEPYELTHWGIKNMKWGIRRFQNKDGSLTPEGGKRYNGSDYQPRKSLGQKISDYKKASAKKKQLEKARAARAEKKRAEEEAKAKAEQRKKDVESGKIKAKDLTSDELRDRINRLNDEKRYKQLMEETGHTSVIETYRKHFAKKMWDQAIVPAATEAGKELVKKAILDASKKDAPVEEFNLDKMWKNRNKMTTKQIKDVQDRLNAENAIKKMMDKREKDKRAEDQAKEDAKQAKKESKQAKKEAKQDKKEAKQAKKEAEKNKKQAAKEKAEKEQAMKDYEAYQEKERSSREDQRSNIGEPSKTGNDIPNRKEYTNSDATNPARYSNVTNPPAVLRETTTKLANVNINSKEYADKVYKGQQEYDIIDKNGKTVVRFDEKGKPKKFWQG